MKKFKFILPLLAMFLVSGTIFGQSLNAKDCAFWARPKIIIPDGLPKFGYVVIEWARYNGSTYTSDRVDFDFRTNAGHYGNYGVDVIGICDPYWPSSMKVTVKLGHLPSGAQTLKTYIGEGTFPTAPTHGAVINSFDLQVGTNPGGNTTY